MIKKIQDITQDITQVQEKIDFKEFDKYKVWKTVYGKKLESKKNVLEYIDIIKKLSKEDLTENQVAQIYGFIDEAIHNLSSNVKANTVVYLKNELRAKLGKFAPEKAAKQNHFLDFFKQTYPEKKRTREYTFVLADLSKINDVQVLETLKTVNAFCFKNKLTKEQKIDILPMIERLVDTQHLKYVNQLKSMEGLRKGLNIKIIEDHEMFRVKRFK